MGLLWVLGYKVCEVACDMGALSSLSCGKQWLWHAEAAEGTLVPCMIQRHHKEMVLFSMAMSKSCGVTQWIWHQKRYFSYKGAGWELVKAFTDLGQNKTYSWALRCCLSCSEEIMAEILATRVSETWVSFATSAPITDLPHSRNSVSAHLNGASFHHGSSPCSINRHPL